MSDTEIPQETAPIADKNVKIDEGHYVNEATLELLQRRMEQEVKKRFFQYIGAPVGLSGVMAILYCLFVWVPNNINHIVEESDTIRDNVQNATEAYLTSDSGRNYMQLQVRKSTQNYMSHNDGRTMVRDEVDRSAQGFLAEKTGREIVAEQVVHSTNQFLASAGQQILEKIVKQEVIQYFEDGPGNESLKILVNKQLDSERMTKLVDATIKNLTQSLLKRTDEDLSAAVVNIKVKAQKVGEFTKSDIGTLRNYFRSPAFKELKKSGMPLALTLHLRHGNQYAMPVLSEYMNELGDALPEQFKFILLYDRDGSYLGLVPARQFSDLLRSREKGRLLMELVNFNDDSDKGEKAFRELLYACFGEVPPVVATNKTIFQLLSEVDWRLFPHVPVQDKTGKIIGVTNKQSLEATMLTSKRRPQDMS